MFDLSEIQAEYILEMPLRRLTKFSRIELEKEQDELERTIAELTAHPRRRGAAARLVSDELAEVAKTYGTPRRTVLLESGRRVRAAAAAPLEVADDPCWVLLSSTGLLARTTTDEPLAGPTGRARPHDVVVSRRPRPRPAGEVGAVTVAGPGDAAARARPAGAAADGRRAVAGRRRAARASSSPSRTASGS